MLKRLFLCLSIAIVPQGAAAASVFTARPDDPAAVYVDAPDPQAASADHTALLQAAVDRAAASPAGGLVLVPAGRYRVTRTLIVWRAVRLIGYGATRPVFVLPEQTPGFQTGLGVMVHFTNARPGAGSQGGGPRVAFPPPGFVPSNDKIPDANQTTFYSSMMNVDFEIGDGNPAAVALRFHVAQHGILSDIDFVQYQFLLYGIALVLMMLFRPEGLFPNVRRRRELHTESAGEEELVSPDEATPEV